METRDFGIRLRELRKQAGLSQRQLADKIGVNFTYLSKIESGVLPPPSEKVILRLAEVLNADIDELMTSAGKIPADIAQMLKNRETWQLLRSSRVQQKSRSVNKGERISIMKSLMSYRRFARVAIAVVLVAAVATSLWFVAPLPVKALDISFPSLPTTGTLGSTYSFQVKVDVGNLDILPVVKADLEIRNTASPTTYKATLADLPLNAGSKSYTSAETGGGAVTVSASTAYGWVWASADRRGYGYREPEGLGYHYFGTSLGYGYGYDSYQGITSITYSITWTPPSSWPVGSYNVKALVYGDGAKKFSGSSASFVLSTPPAVASGAGVVDIGVRVVAPGVTDISNVITNTGVFLRNVSAKSADAKVELTIPAGTIGKTAAGTPLSQISATVMSLPPAPPADASIVGLTYDLGPDGATFSPAITLTFSYDPAQIPAGVNEKELRIAIYDKTTSQWVILEGAIVDPLTRTIRVAVSHFTAFIIIAPTPIAPPVPVIPPAVFSTSALSVSPAEVKSGESVTISVRVANSGGLGGSHTVTLKINNVAEATKYVTLAGGTSTTVPFTTARDVAGTYSVNIDNLSASFTVKAPVVPAAFSTSALTISPAEVKSGESVTISVRVANSGGLSGSYTVTLKINNVAEATKEVTLAGGASQQVTFTTVKDAAATYTVDVNGLSGSFAVKVPVVPPVPVNWWLIGGIVAGVVIIGLIVWLVVRRRIA